MGGGSYSFDASATRTQVYAKSSREEIFAQRKITNLMDPKNTIRECCDSDEHPNTVPIIIALDITGSMGFIPEAFIREEMTKMMGDLYRSGIKDAQVLFMGIGDHKCDRAPLQVGQFEADDELLDKWLKDIYLEGGGGGNGGESYLLAWYYASRQTKLDATERGEKGFLFTIGDDKTHTSVSSDALSEICGDAEAFRDVSASRLLNEASQKYEVYHLNTSETWLGAEQDTQASWKEMLGDRAIMLKSYKEIANTISEIVNSKSVVPGSVSGLISNRSESVEITDDAKEEVIL